MFILDSVKDTDFYKKNRVCTTDSRFVALATKVQSLDYLALCYFTSLLRCACLKFMEISPKNTPTHIAAE